MVLVPIASGADLARQFLSDGERPFDPEWEWKFPKKSALMAMAGPRRIPR